MNWDNGQKDKRAEKRAAMKAGGKGRKGKGGNKGKGRRGKK